MKILESYSKIAKNLLVEQDDMDKEIENPKTGNKIKIRTALQLPDEHPAKKEAEKILHQGDKEEPKDEPSGKLKGSDFERDGGDKKTSDGITPALDRKLDDYGEPVKKYVINTAKVKNIIDAGIKDDNVDDYFEALKQVARFMGETDKYDDAIEEYEDLKDEMSVERMGLENYADDILSGFSDPVRGQSRKSLEKYDNDIDRVQKDLKRNQESIHPLKQMLDKIS